MTLKIVVLPAPFGPTRQVMRPCSTVKLQSCSARRPPKLTSSPVALEVVAHSFSPARPCGRNSMNAISSTP